MWQLLVNIFLYHYYETSTRLHMLQKSIVQVHICYKNSYQKSLNKIELVQEIKAQIPHAEKLCMLENNIH